MQIANPAGPPESPGRPHRTAALAVFFLAPFIGEMLSTSAPPAEYFNPLGFVILHILYGGGALLAHELIIRWKKGLPSLLLLGAAYGLAEEALMCKSFFDPNWPDVGLLGSYGRALSVNWIWSIELTIFHAVFSIAIPIGIVSLLFASARRQPWIGAWGFRIITALWILNGIVIFTQITPYRPPVVPFLAAFGLTILLIVLARVLRAPAPSPSPTQLRPARRPLWFALVGLVATPTFFLSAWLMPQHGPPPILTALTIIAVPTITMVVIYRLSGNAWRWLPRQLAALILGGLGFLLFLCVARANEQNPPDNPQGLGLAAAVAILALIALNLYIRRYREKEGTDTR